MTDIGPDFGLRPVPPAPSPPRLPQIEDLDDIVDIDTIGSKFGYKRARIREFMRGKDCPVALPYVRIGRTPYFSQRQVAWWLNRLQEQVDPRMVDVKRATRQESKPA